MSSGKRDRQIARELDRLCVECNVNPKVDRFELCSACYGNRTRAPSRRHHCCICNINGDDDVCSSCSNRAPPNDATYEQGHSNQKMSNINNVLKKFSLSMGNGQQVCSICFDTIEPQQNMTTLPCFDMFHKECISSWFKQKLVCPLHTDNPLS
jgi:hypothetical protein